MFSDQVTIFGNHDYTSGGDPIFNALEKLNEIQGNLPKCKEINVFNQVIFVPPGLKKEETKYHKYHIERGNEGNRKIILLSHHQLFSRYIPIDKYWKKFWPKSVLSQYWDWLAKPALKYR